MRKYVRHSPYNNFCDNNHDFIKSLDVLICKKCNWIKYKVEIDAEKIYMDKIERRNQWLNVKFKHIDLFHFQ
jgi:hypothetical protein